MKRLFIAIVLTLCGAGVGAQTLDDPQWHIEKGEAELEGEPSATAKDARAAWKKSCEDWKKEFRADNKDNKILSLACGSANCTGKAGGKICTSKATYRIKTRLE